MSFLRNMWTDLVEKRLWPVAAVLLVALVAVPVVLGSSSSAEPTAAAVGATGTSGASGLLGGRAEVTLAPGVPVRRDRAGTLRDPFKQRGKPATAATAPTGTTGASGSADAPAAPAGGGSAGGSDSPAGGATGSSGPSGDAPKPKAPAPADVYSVKVRFGPSDGRHDTRTVARLTPLPAGDTPFLVFLGALSDKKTAVFLLSSDVTATGDGSCRPRASSCETVELKAGDSELLELTADDGSTRSYDLELVKVVKGDPTDGADVVSSSDGSPETTAAQAAGTDEPAGSGSSADDAGAADDASSADDGSDRYRFDSDSGLLRRLATTSKLSARAAPRSAAPEGFADGAPSALPRSVPTP